jgi:hypothetical protein
MDKTATVKMTKVKMTKGKMDTNNMTGAKVARTVAMTMSVVTKVVMRIYRAG